MLSGWPAPILFDIAILCTSLSWAVGFYAADRRVHLVASLATGCFVCLIGYSVSSLGAPVWAVIAAPLPVDVAMLWYVLRDGRKMVISYVWTWGVYLVLHVGLSSLLRYDSLVPGWRVHG